MGLEWLSPFFFQRSEAPLLHQSDLEWLKKLEKLNTIPAEHSPASAESLFSGIISLNKSGKNSINFMFDVLEFSFSLNPNYMLNDRH